MFFVCTSVGMVLAFIVVMLGHQIDAVFQVWQVQLIFFLTLCTLVGVPWFFKKSRGL